MAFSSYNFHLEIDLFETRENFIDKHILSYGIGIFFVIFPN